VTKGIEGNVWESEGLGVGLVPALAAPIASLRARLSTTEFPCHPERSEGSVAVGVEVLRCAQHDKVVLLALNHSAPCSPFYAQVWKGGWQGKGREALQFQERDEVCNLLAHYPRDHQAKEMIVACLGLPPVEPESRAAIVCREGISS
jgi:hypothetical protein